MPDDERGPRRRSTELEGVVVVVVGAGSSGTAVSNGEAAARTYGRAGAEVVCVDRDAEAAERVADLVRSEGGTASALRADATDDADVRRCTHEVVRRHGLPGVLHHNVGRPWLGEVVDLDPLEWDAAVATNLTACFLTLRHVLPLMLERGKGAVVTVSSVAAVRETGYPYPAYAAAKAAVDRLTVSVALTYAARGVRANAVQPGLIDTPLVHGSLGDDPGALAARHAQSPTGRMGSPWDVAEAALFLASDRAAYVNGVCLPVDGGLSARCG